MGRTGKLFAHEHGNSEQGSAAPDILASAKALGGGFPVGACLATQEASKGMVRGVHGTTYGGNPLAMAVGNAVLDIMLEDGFLEAVEQRALRLKQGLASLVDQYPHVFVETRGAGLLTGVKCAIPNTDVLAAIYGQKMLSVPAGDNVIRILPPLNVTDDEIADGLSRLDAAAALLSVHAA